MLDLPDIATSAPAFYQPVTVECVQAISEEFSLHPDILWAILMVEQGTVGEEVKHSNGSEDIGVAQISSQHMKELTQLGISREELRNDGCINLAFAAAYVRRMIQGQRIVDAESYLQAIARYHNKSEPYNSDYAERLRGAFNVFYGQPPPAKQSPPG